MHLTPDNVLQTLTASTPFAEAFRHDQVSVELYQPVGQDLQQPHEYDEIYIILKGTGVFNNGGTRHSFEAGDFIFVAKGVEHRFEQFSDDFSTWVIFYPAQGAPKK
jgi:mannose-6-phosphate isomerase-like protein (cupin superfamily)